MARFFKKRDQSQGLSSGAVVFIGNQKTKNSLIRIIDFDSTELTEQETEESEGLRSLMEKNTVSWVNMEGLHDVDAIKRIGEQFNLHPLILSDIVDTAARPKIAEHDDTVFVQLKMIWLNEETAEVTSDQLSVVLGPTYLLTFQEKFQSVFEPVKIRIRNKKGRIRQSGNDYLAYALLDTIIDNYIYTVERLGEKIEDLEDIIITNPGSDIIEQINHFKREMNYLRKSIRPARELIQKLARLDSELIHDNTRPFLKDLLDLSTEATEAIDTYRDMLSDQLDIYNSIVNNKMNDIMKVLTIFAAIFIPLTFIAGIYGTNFEYLPELKFRYSYYIFWSVLIFITIVMLVIFKRKKWF